MNENIQQLLFGFWFIAETLYYVTYIEIGPRHNIILCFIPLA